MQLMIFEQTKRITIDDGLIIAHNESYPEITTDYVEFLLNGDGIDKDTNLSEDDLNRQVDEDLRDELSLLIETRMPENKAKAFSLAEKMLRESKS